MNYKLINPINNQYSPIEQILTNRGIEHKDIQDFLNIDSFIEYPPTLLKNMREGAKMLIKHLAKQNKVFIQVDSDCDGMTSAALLINYLNRVAPYYAQNFITYRVHEKKEHGLYFETIPEGTKLAIVPDAGSNDYEVHEKCAAAGIDVLILDHHEAKFISDNACVINNQLCDYPTKSLSGVGVVYKFCTYLDELLHTSHAEDFLDLVSLGLIADVMDTRDFETQYYIQEGLKHVRNPFYLAMINKDGMHFKSGEIPLMNDVAWYVAPFINAVNRVGTVEEKIIIFEAMLDFKAYTQIPSTKRGCKGMMETLVEQACRVATKVKNRQNDLVDELLVVVEKIIKEQNILDNQVLIIPFESGSKSLNGLVANKLSNRYQRPTLVLQRVEADDIVTYEGSARGYDKSDLKDFKEFLAQTPIDYAEGHKNAFGVGIKEERMNELQEFCNDNLDMGQIKYDVDFIWDARFINEQDVLTIAGHKHLWGQKVDEPLVVLENLRLTDDNVSFIGRNGKTLRIDNDKFSIIKFFITDEEKEALTPNGETWTANVIVTCDRNDWNGRSYAQFKLVDIEIIKKEKWVF